ncbi:MAG: hypothetical protein QM541_15570 [Flavobacterium sp.]|nr:hypothetical protein [Flavobacterium sp.]
MNLDNFLAVLVTNQMFKKIEEQETNICSNVAAKTSPTLQRVFGKDCTGTSAKY